jgi:hypothetical protein
VLLNWTGWPLRRFRRADARGEQDQQRRERGEEGMKAHGAFMPGPAAGFNRKRGETRRDAVRAPTS